MTRPSLSHECTGKDAESGNPPPSESLEPLVETPMRRFMELAKDIVNANPQRFAEEQERYRIENASKRKLTRPQSDGS